MNLANTLRQLQSRLTRSVPARRSARLRIDPLEAREVPAGLALDFDTSKSPTPVGYLHGLLAEYTPVAGFGWQSLTEMGAASRPISNLINKDFHFGADSTFVADLPNGTYDLVIGLGDGSATRDRMSVWVEGVQLVSDLTTKAGQFADIRARVTVTDGQLTLRLADGGGTTPKFAVTKLCATPTDPNAVRIWPDGAAPPALTSSVRTSTELGLRFQVSADAEVRGVRFYKNKANTGTHVGSLWSADGTRLATATFVNETAKGWQEVYFDTPVAISANQTYVVSYTAPKGRYSVTQNYFNPSGIQSGPIKVLPPADGGGAVCQTGGAFPDVTKNGCNLWVDVVLVGDVTAPTVSSVVPANGTTGVATSANVQVTFSELMDPATVTATSVLLRTPAGSNVPATVVYDPATRIATLNPLAPLALGTQYTVRVLGGTGTNRVRDLAGNPMAANFSSVFTTVQPAGPTANAGSDKTGNEATSVSFTGSATGGVAPLTYHWDFGDGGTADGTLTPSHTYADDGVYTVTLTVTDANNNSDSDTATVTVNNVAPTASLSNNGPVNTNAQVTISFANQNDVSAPDRTAGYKYSYDFDNNGTWEQTDVTSATASTSFATAGNKVVKARIKDKDGGFTDYTTTVTVNGPPNADAGTDKTANEASSVSFTGTAGGGVGTLTYQWDFGDGGSASGTLNPSHTYADNGVYTVTLTVTDANNNSDSDTATVTVNNVAPTASLSNNGPVLTGANVNISFGSQNDVSAPDRTAGYKYSYDFDNNGTWEQTDVTGASATTSFATAGNKVVKARIKDKDGGFTDYTTTVVVVGAPVVNAGADKTANEAASVSFTGTATGGLAPLTYEWTFGDGGSSSGSLTPSRTYADNGVYTVTLTVTDALNQVVSDTATVTVNNVAPTASLSNNGPVNTNATVTISFANQNDVSGPDRTAGYKYSYDFDNNGTWEQTDVTSATANTSYATAGNKVVKARIKDKDGGFTDYTTTVVVENPGQTPTFYVSTTGNDNNNGSSGSPWRTLQKAANTAVAGDTIVVRAGTYAGFRTNGRSSWGTAANPITFKADPGVKLTSKAPGAGSNEGIINVEAGSPRSDYIIIDGFEVDGSNTTGRGIRFAQSRHNIVRNCVVHDAEDTNIFANTCNFLQVINNICYDARGQHGIYVNGTDNYVIRGNTTYGNNWNGIHTNVSDGSNQINSNGLIENNVVRDNALAGMDLTGMNTTTIRNNLVYGNGRHAIVLQNSNQNATTACHDNLIVNNTLDARAGSSAYAIQISAVQSQPSGSPWTSNDQNTTIRNNILLANTSSGYGAIGNLGGVSASFTSDYNIVVDRFRAGSSSQTLAQWQTATGEDAHSIISTASALFVNAAGEDYRLKAGSPAIDQGTSTNAPPTDIAGATRPQGAGIDIGAYESF
jgi:parallel beta-helix repeat protein